VYFKDIADKHHRKKSTENCTSLIYYKIDLSLIDVRFTILISQYSLWSFVALLWLMIWN